MAIVKLTCEQLEGLTWQTLFMNAFLYDDVNDCFILASATTGASSSAGGAAGSVPLTGAAGQVIAANSVRSLTLVVTSGTVSDGTVTYPVGTYTWTGSNGGFITNALTFDSSSGTGFFLTMD